MRFLADDRDRHRALAPQGEIERQPAQHRDDDVQHLRWDSGHVEDCNRLAIDRNAQQLRNDRRQFVAHRQPVAEHECVAGIRLEGLQAGADRLISGDVLGPAEAAHRRIEEALDVG